MTLIRKNVWYPIGYTHQKIFNPSCANKTRVSVGTKDEYVNCFLGCQENLEICQLTTSYLAYIISLPYTQENKEEKIASINLKVV